jgi:hypothetical protein
MAVVNKPGPVRPFTPIGVFYFAEANLFEGREPRTYHASISCPLSGRHTRNVTEAEVYRDSSGTLWHRIPVADMKNYWDFSRLDEHSGGRLRWGTVVPCSRCTSIDEPAIVASRLEWESHGLCYGTENPDFFPTSQSQQERFDAVARAKAICARCPVLIQCRDYGRALYGPGPKGLNIILGGETSHDRKKALSAMG